MFEIIVGKKRIRHRTTLNSNDNLQSILIRYRNAIFESFYVESDSHSDNDFNNKMNWVWTNLNSFEVIKVILML